jgi:phosphoribosylamine--glycine ligase
VRILVIGSGGREHALVWKIARSGQVKDPGDVFAAPGNGGTLAEGATNVPINADDIDGLVAFAKRERIDLAVPGPELPLTLGIVDRMRDAGIAAFGPDAYCAQLEGSKAFAKEIMAAAGVPTAASAIFTDLAAAKAHLADAALPVVIKADGLAAGKGVVIARTREEALGAIGDMMETRVFGTAGDRIVMEEFLEGEEVSLLCLCHGTRAVPLPSAQDHKTVFDGDTGPNTGGMGAYSPAPVLPDSKLGTTASLVVEPVLRELERRGHSYTGVLYAGLMITRDGPKVLEYNVRFGDPECEPLLMRLETDLVLAMKACIDGRLERIDATSQTAIGVVMAAKGYPGAYAKGIPIQGIPEADKLPGVKVFHCGTRREGDRLLSAGGRVLCVTALGSGLAMAKANAYQAVERITMDGAHYRHDIGDKGLRRLQGAG